MRKFKVFSIKLAILVSIVLIASACTGAGIIFAQEQGDVITEIEAIYRLQTPGLK